MFNVKCNFTGLQIGSVYWRLRIIHVMRLYEMIYALHHTVYNRNYWWNSQLDNSCLSVRSDTIFVRYKNITSGNIKVESVNKQFNIEYHFASHISSTPSICTKPKGWRPVTLLMNPKWSYFFKWTFAYWEQ